MLLAMMAALNANVVLFSHHHCSILVLRITCDFWIFTIPIQTISRKPIFMLQLQEKISFFIFLFHHNILKYTGTWSFLRFHSVFIDCKTKPEKVFFTSILRFKSLILTLQEFPEAVPWVVLFTILYFKWSLNKLAFMPSLFFRRKKFSKLVLW